MRSTIAAPCLALIACSGRVEQEQLASRYFPFVGGVSVRSTFDGEVSCDVDATLTGEPYLGECPDCEFTFAHAIDDTITRDESSPDCSYFSMQSFIETWSDFDLVMAHTPTFTDYIWDEPTRQDVFLTGWSFRYWSEKYDDAEVWYGTYFTATAYDGSPYATFSRSGDDVSWSYLRHHTYDETVSNHFQDCGAHGYSYTKEGFGVPGTGTPSTIDCAADVIDVWTFEADGGPATITLDTLSEASGFNARLDVNDPAGCTVISSSHNFECTYHPRTFTECPSVSFDSTTHGTYTVVVSAHRDCPSVVAEYELRVGGATNLTLIEDEAPEYIDEHHERTAYVVGSGRFTRP